MFRISTRDVLTWEGERFPVYLVVFDAQREKAHAVYLQRYFEQNGIDSSMMTTNSIVVRLPGDEIERSTIEEWRNDKNEILAQIGGLRHA